MVEEEGAHAEVVPMGIGYMSRERFQSIFEDFFKSDSLCILSVTGYERFLVRGGGNRK